MGNMFKTICLKQVVKINGLVNGKHNEIQDQLITDIAERVYNNLATPQVNGRIELYSGGSLVKQLIVTVANLSIEDITNGKQVSISVADDSADEYQVDELRLYSAVSGYDGSGTSALYSVYTLETPVSKASNQVLYIKWQLQFVKGGA